MLLARRVLCGVLCAGVLLLLPQFLTKGPSASSEAETVPTQLAKQFAKLNNVTALLNGTSMPKILHQVFKSDTPYENYKAYINSCLTHNPDWQYYLWRDEDAEKLIAQRLPAFLPKYKKYKDPLEKSDSIRYIVLYLLGGVYLDMDVECLRPLPTSLTSLPAFLDQERHEQTRIHWNRQFSAMNSAMGSVPGHPFFKLMIDAMSSNKRHNVMYSTGPILLTEVYTKYKSAGTQPSVTLLEPHVMSPLMDRFKNWKHTCRNVKQMSAKAESRRSWFEKGCLMLQSKNWRIDGTNNDTVCAHKFEHLGYAMSRRLRKKPFSMKQAFGNRIQFWT